VSRRPIVRSEDVLVLRCRGRIVVKPDPRSANSNAKASKSSAPRLDRREMRGREAGRARLRYAPDQDRCAARTTPAVPDEETCKDFRRVTAAAVLSGCTQTARSEGASLAADPEARHAPRRLPRDSPTGSTAGDRPSDGPTASGDEGSSVKRISGSGKEPQSWCSRNSGRHHPGARGGVREGRGELARRTTVSRVP
jgi:hypothetical protein